MRVDAPLLGPGADEGKCTKPIKVEYIFNFYSMKITAAYLSEFEKGLNPQHPEKSTIPAEVIGFGEISSIFKINGYPGWIYKRLPLFDDEKQAGAYVQKYEQYIHYLKKAGIGLPEDFSRTAQGKKVVLYLAQQELNKADICHIRLHAQTEGENIKMLENILLEIKKIYQFNQQNKPAIELSIDGQVSNWAMVNGRLLYFDTSTPLFKINGKEQMDPELLLNSTPRALRWVIRSFFLQEVMDRYYDIRLVYVDLIANLHKEKKQDLINKAIELANDLLPADAEKITRKEVDKYYQDDKFIWQLFLALRKMDRWTATNIFRKQYEFILPGKIER